MMKTISSGNPVNVIQLKVDREGDVCNAAIKMAISTATTVPAATVPVTASLVPSHQDSRVQDRIRIQFHASN